MLLLFPFGGQYIFSVYFALRNIASNKMLTIKQLHQFMLIGIVFFNEDGYD